MYVFIDTTVFLSFYECSSEDLNELEKLVDYTIENKISLCLPKQVVQEFHRNRERVIDKAMRELRNPSIPSEFPRMCIDYPEYDMLRKRLREYSGAHQLLMSKLSEDIINETLKADLLIARLFAATEIIPTREDVVRKARRRIELGNPPGEAGSIGDAVNWETLLDVVPEGHQLFFVSNDKDFQSRHQAKAFHPYLDKEWTQEKKSNLEFFSTLTEAFRPFSLKIILSEYIDKQEALRSLSSSPRFRDTHAAVERLATFGADFDIDQLNRVIRIVVSNSQVGWIFWDRDIQDFFWQLIDGRLDKIYRETLLVFQPWLHEALNTLNPNEIEPEIRERCQEILDLDPRQAPPEPPPLDDIPF